MNLKIVHNGEDITDKLKFSSCYLYDRYGGMLDSLTIEFPEDKTDFIFGQYDEISVITDSYNTGIMYIDDVFFNKGRYIISAIPYKQSNKQKTSGVWKNIQFSKMAKDISLNNGLELKMYGVKDVTYKSLTRINEYDLEFLNRISKREGCSIKIYNNELIIFNEKHIENDYKALDISVEDVDPDYSFKIATNGAGGVTVQYFDIETDEFISYTAEDKNIEGGMMVITEHLKDVGEAQRFANGYLRNFNKNEITGTISVNLNSNISACTLLNLQNFSEFSGQYVVYEVTHDILNEKTIIKIRKTLTY